MQNQTVRHESIRFEVVLMVHALISQHGDVTLFTACKCFHYEWLLLRVVHVYVPNNGHRGVIALDPKATFC